MYDISYCSDKYQYTMGKTFYDSGMKDKIAIFNLFFRKAPDNNNWAVVCGIKEALEMIKNLGNAPASFFEKFLPGDDYAEYREFLANMKFTGDVYAMREGEIAFPREPIITVKAPIIEAQVLETPLLCIMNHQMAVATKASRVTRATNKPVSEFGSRRAHGPWAAVHGGKAAYLAGCANSSNVLTACKFGLESSGTMAHSYTTSFGCTIEGEYKAFDTYIKTHKNEGLILLIDTFDTLKCGIINAIKAFKNNGIDDNYQYGYGVRLDSGDLTYLSQECRKALDNAGLTKCKIFATNSLDEYIITDLERQNAKIDAYGVGDAIATSKHNPCFGNVYKLVQLDDEPLLKRSEDKIKLINPGFQITYRLIVNGRFEADVTCLRGDKTSQKITNNKNISIRDEMDQTKRTAFKSNSYTWKELQIPAIKNGVVVMEDTPLTKEKEYYLDNLSRFDETQKRILNPHYYKVDISDELYDVKMDIIDNLVAEINELSRDFEKSYSHVVVDMLYDFIDGSLACNGTQEAIKNAVKHIRKHPEEKVLYVADCHPANHCSFKDFGGIWPAHCVEGTHGGKIASEFYSIPHKINRPDASRNIYYKGCNKDLEQYSGFDGINAKGETLKSQLTRNVFVSGIATEYCIKETCKDLINNGFTVHILSEALGYITPEGHEESLKELEELGVFID